MGRMDLAATSVFLDFDGTVTTEDTGVHVLARLARPGWPELEDLYVSGEIGSRECMARQWAMLPRDRARVEAAAAEVPLDPGFLPLVGYLREKGAEVAILSDGFGFRAEEVGAGAGLPVITNAIDWESWSVLFPNEDPSCECGRCGACKRRPIREAGARGRHTVLVGDGASDFKGAAVADVVFAKGALALWCRRHGVVFEPFADLFDVRRLLAELSGETPGR